MDIKVGYYYRVPNQDYYIKIIDTYNHYKEPGKVYLVYKFQAYNREDDKPIEYFPYDTFSENSKFSKQIVDMVEKNKSIQLKEDLKKWLK